MRSKFMAAQSEQLKKVPDTNSQTTETAQM